MSFVEHRMNQGVSLLSNFFQFVRQVYHNEVTRLHERDNIVLQPGGLS